MSKPPHVNWLVKTKERLKTADGKPVEVWEFCHQPDDAVLSAWAKHFREHYCLEDEVDYFRRGFGYSRAEFLNKIKFPDASEAPGPGVRSGDFGEILIADYLEYVLNFWVPRARYGAKVIGNESSKGCDTLGFFFVKDGEASPKDMLAIYEAKARLTGDQLTNGKKLSGFQSAINDSAKDEIRKGHSLNYLKQRLFDKGKLLEAEKIERFQNPNDRPYIEVYGAVAIFSSDSFIPATITTATATDHPKKNALRLLVIKGKQLMPLVTELYRRAADEA